MPTFDPTRPTMSDIATLCGIVQPKPAKPNPFDKNPPTICTECREPIDTRRANIGKTTCIECQADIDKTQPPTRTIVPMHKSNYIPIFDPADLLGINNKGGLVK